MDGKYRRVLIKISGEALSGGKGTGYDIAFVTEVCESVKRCLKMGVQVGIVIGGGNFWRGVKDGAGKIERVSADRMGIRLDGTPVKAENGSDIISDATVTGAIQIVISTSAGSLYSPILVPYTGSCL